ncbi:transglutaminase TgpA family protein [Paeniglutamicibacter cryotolerans]|uniref:Transglutaminase-like putative cysteine protease n=1 Tax=Paeniglutamicibacter cryotolerans TaxID=670079 RepID=A0A839QMI3_9MICC|nr:DUF3488 and transglutaminase-like domain-containing protein [Paeniglutamicibacter cryotolerans]MBB2995964.1 transglutaminase-like putative cysteine protease [Paeniglutamicibacter cryotolerans]
MTSTLQRPVPPPPAPEPGAGSRRFPRDPEHARAAWFAALAAFTLTGAAALSLNGVVQGYSWLPQVLFTLFLTLGSAALTRTLGGRSLLPSVVAAAGLVASQTFLFFSNTALLGFIPTPRTVAGVRLVAIDLQDQIMSQIAPLNATGPVVLLVALGAGTVALSVEFLAFGLRLPAVAGIPPLILLAVSALFKPDGAGLVFLLLGAAGYLLVLAAGRRMEAALLRIHIHQDAVPGSLRGGSAPQGMLLIAAAVAVMLLVPLALPGFSSGALPQGQRPHLFGTPTGVNPLLTLGNNLRDGSESTSLTYFSNSPDPVYLRTSIVGNLDQAQWKPSESDGRQSFDGALPVDQVQYAVALVDPTTTEIRTGLYNSPWLPLPGDTRTVTGLRGDWSWSGDTWTLRAEPGTSTTSQQYTATSFNPQVSPARMRALGPGDSGGVGVPQEYLSMPADMPRSIVETARTAVDAENAGNPFDQAVALQDYLRGGSFTYSEQTPLENGYDGSGVAVVVAFLEKRSGYCVHFASSMALMARTLGIPSRIVTGYAPGRSTGTSITGTDGSKLSGYALSSRSAHAWPELYFEGAGWVPFEPTPGRGRTPSYARSALESETTPQTQPEANPTRAPRPIPSSSPSPVPQGQADPGTGPGPGSGAQLPWQVFVLPGLLLAGLVPRLLRTIARRRRVSAGTGAAAWEELVALGTDYGVPMQSAESAAGYARRLTAGLPQAAESLGLLRAAYERETYAASGSPETPGLRAAVEAAHAALREDADPRGRLLAGFAPRSLIGRAADRGHSGEPVA